jgi:hypothetical protein
MEQPNKAMERNAGWRWQFRFAGGDFSPAWFIFFR